MATDTGVRERRLPFTVRVPVGRFSSQVGPDGGI
jgi:hypothetical protein